MDMQSLREKAEIELQRKIESLDLENKGVQAIEETREELRHFLHELQVHEQELEIQNQELRCAQVELERSRDRYAELFDFAPIGYVTLDGNGVIREINLTLTGMVERERVHLIGFPFIHFVSREDKDAFLGHLMRCRNGEGKITTELHLTVRNAEALPVELCSQAVRVQGRDEPAIRTAITDIRERVQAKEALLRAHRELEQRVIDRTAELQAEIHQRELLEQELRRRMDEMAEADRHKDDFLAMLSHELRNPLAAIANVGEILRRKAPEDEIFGRISRVIKEQATHLKHLLDDLLDITRLIRGKIVLRHEIVDVADVVRKAVDANQGLIEECRHRLNVSLPPEPVYLHADEPRCVQIVSNLLHNAAKFTKPGGEIELMARRENDEVVIRIRDSGAGIPPELLGHIFEPFVQEDHSLARSAGGLGIGLAMVKRLAEMHGGRVEVSSPGKGQGSEFVVRLPVASAPLAPQEDGRSGVDAEPSSLQVVVVDDNHDHADSLGFLLRTFGYEVHVFYDGSSMLEFARGHRPDMVLLDLGMPKMDGYEVARRLRQDPALEHTKLIAVSGYGTEEDKRQSQRAGFDYHVVKPVDIDALRELLAR